ncbi:MAG: hypothetical protein ACYTGH_18075 [Planctomycetota bacterium]|jgi:chromosome segregation ATPase
MTDVAREKYMRLMEEIENTEEMIENLEKEVKVAEDSPNPDDAPAIREELQALQEKLATQKAELSRLSDGCGPGRGQ